MSETPWYCCRQRAGPLVKECRAIRPRLSPEDSPYDRRRKNEIIKCAHTAVCRSRADRLELRLALFGFEGSHYTLTFDSTHLPPKFDGVRRCWRAFMGRMKRWKKRPFDYIYCVEGRHGDHRYHIHLILRDGDFSPTEVRFLWRYGDADDEPLLRNTGGFRRLAEYLNKEATDGFVLPIGRRPWNCSRSLSGQLPPPEKWLAHSGVIPIPDDAGWSNRGECQNDFGSYFYGNYICGKNSALYLDNDFNLET